ncbi:Rv3654c family TadE-like protein [Streptosporangium sp. NPDC051022]|uniref:Rv3654c family TadE-like protein n=1 Tax=Streptosporangium sp. NPDC051022 TaxID=3155752 RepID=UPI003428B6D9
MGEPRFWAVGGRGGGDRGAATIWTVGIMALIFSVATAVVFAGTARVARHRARNAADLSALAAARLAFADPARGCAQASSLAVGNGAKLVRCSIDAYGIADVQVTVVLSLPAVGSQVITAEARAGPVHIADTTG